MSSSIILSWKWWNKLFKCKNCPIENHLAVYNFLIQCRPHSKSQNSAYTSTNFQLTITCDSRFEGCDHQMLLFIISPLHNQTDVIPWGNYSITIPLFWTFTCSWQNPVCFGHFHFIQHQKQYDGLRRK